MASERASKVWAVTRYTLLRIALFAAVWLLLELITPLSLVWTLAAAVLMSGAISVVVLDRPRGDAGRAVGGYFGRLNARIEASARAEDEADDRARLAASAVATSGQDTSAQDASTQGDRQAEDEAVAEKQDSGGLQSGDESGSARS